MNAVPAVKYMSVEEYLAMEDVSDKKHDFIGGAIEKAPSLGFQHSQIVANCFHYIASFLQNNAFGIYGSDLKVHIKNKLGNVSPDLTIVCNHPQFLSEAKGVIINPIVIVEVLGEDIDNEEYGDKFRLYREVESLSELFFIRSLEVSIEKYKKEPTGHWTLKDHWKLNDELVIDAIDFQISLAKIYRDVHLPERDWNRGLVRGSE